MPFKRKTGKVKHTCRNKKPEKPRPPFLVNKRLSVQRVPQISQLRAGGAVPRARRQRPRQVSCSGHCPRVHSPLLLEMDVSGEHGRRGLGTLLSTPDVQVKGWSPSWPSSIPARPAPPGTKAAPAGCQLSKDKSLVLGEKNPFSDSQLNLALDSAPPASEQRAAERWTELPMAPPGGAVHGPRALGAGHWARGQQRTVPTGDPVGDVWMWSPSVSAAPALGAQVPFLPQCASRVCRILLPAIPSPSVFSSGTEMHIEHSLQRHLQRRRWGRPEFLFGGRVQQTTQLHPSAPTQMPRSCYKSRGLVDLKSYPEYVKWRN